MKVKNVLEVIQKILFSSYTNSSPANGDLWYDGTDMLVRLSGATKALLSGTVPAANGGSLPATIADFLADSGATTPNIQACLTTSKFIYLPGWSYIRISNAGSWSSTAIGGTVLSRGVASNGDVVIVSGTGTSWRRSTDAGATFGQVSHGLTTATYSHLKAGGDNGSSTVWIAGHSNSASLGGISTDNGATWANKAIFSTQSCVAILNDGGTGGSTEWLALTSSTACRKSTDNGATWAAGSTLGFTPTHGFYALGKFWAVDGSGNIQYAANVAAAWTTFRRGAGTNAPRAYGYTNSKFCYLDSAGAFWTCADPITSNLWTIEGHLTVTWTGIATVLYYNGKYHIVGGDGSNYGVCCTLG